MALIDVLQQAIEGARKLQAPSSFEGGFGPTAFIAPWEYGMFYRKMTQADPPDTKTWKFSQTRGAGGYTRYYFADYNQAQEFSAYIYEQEGGDRDYGAQQVQVFQTRTLDVLNTKDPLALASDTSWGPRICFENVCAGVRSGQFHESQMVVIPAMVYAMACLQGYSVPEPDFDDILDPDFVLTDQVETQLVGHPDARNASDPRHYTHSRYWQYRTALWKALGEEDSHVYQTIGTTTRKGRPSTLATSSEKLSELLDVVGSSWNKPVYAHVALAKNPRMKYTRGQLPVVIKLYRTKAAAEIDANTMMRSDDNGDTGESVTATALPAGYPAAWAAQEVSVNEWDNMVAGALSEGKTPAVIAAELGDCTAADILKTKKRLDL